MNKKADAAKAAPTKVDIFEPIATRLFLKHPVTDEPIESLWVECVGPESEQYRTVLRKTQRANLAHVKSDDEVEEMEYNIDSNLGILSACVIAWNEEGFGEFDRERVKETLKKYPSLTRQIDAFVGERKNFFRVFGNDAPDVS